jgi:peroxiredoxin
MSHGTRLVALASLLLGGLVLVPGSIPGDDKPPLSDQQFRTESGVVAWADLAGKKATVVVFLSFDCPMSTHYAAPLAEMAKAYAQKGVAFVGFCPGDDGPAEVARRAKEYRLGFPVLADEKLAAATALGAKATPQAVVLDGEGRVRYSGQIDDAYTKRLVPSRKVTATYLKDALDDVLAGKEVRVAKTDPIGCPIAREPRKATGGAVTYHRDVLPILQAHCQSCHRPGEVGPFSLLTYRQAVNWADDIKEYTADRRMPPWKPRGGKEFVGDRRLSEKAIATLARWVDDGCPEGDPKDAPPGQQFPAGWALGPPDLVLTVPGDFTVGATGKDFYRMYVLPTGLTEDKHVVAVDVRPGNTRVVHHAVNFFDATGSAVKAQEAYQAAEAKTRKPGDVDVGAGFSSGMGFGMRLNPVELLGRKPPLGPLGGWAPGMRPRQLPEGTGFLLPKGSDVVMQVHYHRTGKVETDRTQVGLYFANKPVARSMLPVVVPGHFKLDGKGAGTLGYIPAGDSHFVAKGTWYALEDCTLHAVLPHMHLLGKSVKITVTPPGGAPELLIDIPEWDYNWQEHYFFKSPVRVRTGTRFDIEAVFDNSAKNPRNPHDPPVDVRFGEQTTDEMLFGVFGATKDNPSAGAPFVISQGPFRLRR